MVDINLDEVLAQARPKTVTVRVCLRGDLLAEHQRLERELAEAQRLDEAENRHAQAPEIARQVRELEEQIDAAEVEFEFAAIGQKAWSELLALHPPTEQDREDGYGFNQETFPAASVVACASNPKVTEEQMERLREVLNVAQWNKLAGAVLAANMRDVIPFSAAASALLSGSEAKSS